MVYPKNRSVQCCRKKSDNLGTKSSVLWEEKQTLGQRDMTIGHPCR